MSRTQFRANSGAAPAFNEAEVAGEIEGVPAAAKTQTTVAGTRDKIGCEAPDGVASSGAECEVEAVRQQGILPPQPQLFA